MTTWEFYIDLFLSPPNASVLYLPLSTLSLAYFAYWGYEFAFSAVLGYLHISIVDKNMTNCSWQWEGKDFDDKWALHCKCIFHTSSECHLLKSSLQSDKTFFWI